jgi:hypothetical protein
MAEAVEAARRHLESNGVRVSEATIAALTDEMFAETGLAGSPRPFREAFAKLAER